MSSPLVLPRASTRGGFRHPGCAVLPVIGLNVFLGVPAYFVAFLTAYGFVDSITLGEHLTFLTLIAVYAVLAGALAAAPPAMRYPDSTLQIQAFGALTSLAVNATAVSLGSIVSAVNKDQNSVSADFSSTTDVLVAAALVGVAALCACAANAVRRTG